MLKKLPSYVPSYLLTPPQFPPRLPGGQRCGTWCPPVKLKASTGSSSTDPTALHIKAVKGTSPKGWSCNNSSFFPKYLVFFFPAEGQGKKARTCGWQRKQCSWCITWKTRHDLQTVKDPNPTESKHPEMRKREVGGEKVETRKPPYCLADCECLANVFKDWFDFLFRVVLRCIFKFLIY